MPPYTHTRGIWFMSKSWEMGFSDSIVLWMIESQHIPAFHSSVAKTGIRQSSLKLIAFLLMSLPFIVCLASRLSVFSFPLVHPFMALEKLVDSSSGRGREFSHGIQTLGVMALGLRPCTSLILGC
uniref:Alpha-glucosidase 2 n=1 Tax=Rhizophora mucronata TaxID=61149 RepID=A0A2P2J883_RHIMU